MGLSWILKGAPLWLFRSLAFTGIALVIILFLLALLCASSYFTWFTCKSIYKGLRKRCAEEIRITPQTKRSTCLRKYAGLLLWGSGKLNVRMFPGLFKKRKDRYNNRDSGQTATRESILFLDRKVGSNFAILFSFLLLAIAIITSALLVFFRHVPVTISSQCRESDEEHRDLFCYTNGSNWPVDCGNYSKTELEETEFVCYAISILELGIAVAAVLALAKIATFGITIYIRVSAAVYMWSRGNARQYCGIRAKHIYGIYLVFTLLSLEFLACVSSTMITFIIASRWVKSPAGRWSVLVYMAYIILPPLLIPFLIPVMSNLSKHCDQEEYIGCPSDQLPSCVNDCEVHVESGNDHDGLEDPGFIGNANRLSETTVAENVDPASYVVPTVQVGRDGHNDNITPNDTDSVLVINNPSYLTPLLPDHLYTQTSPQLPDSQA